MHVITETPGPAPKLTPAELSVAIDRYQRRIPAQDMRIRHAELCVDSAKAELAKATAELNEAIEARARLATIINDLSDQEI